MPVSAHLRTLAAGLGITLAVPLAAGAPTAAAAAAPRTTVTTVVDGLSIPWDLFWINGLMIYNERDGRIWTKRGAAPAQRLALPLPPIYAAGEAGLLGMVADPNAAANGYFYTCQAVAKPDGDPLNIQVWKWQLTSDTVAVKVKALITGIPLNETGRHSGCRLRFRSAHRLYVGTGDAAKGTNPQNLNSLGGKVLRITADGKIPATNPYAKRKGNARYVWSYGHRNIQGLMTRPGGTELWAVEHGTDRDDEVNRIFKGRNYGWSPTPNYNENRSMTDKKRFPRAVSARWRSGSPTVATSGATFIAGSRWGTWRNDLAVAELKGAGILLFNVSAKGAVTGKREVFDDYGRIRTIQQGPDGDLYFTTSNGSGKDSIRRIRVR